MDINEVVYRILTSESRIQTHNKIMTEANIDFTSVFHQMILAAQETNK